MIITFLQKLRMFPDMLRGEYPQLSRFLHRQGDMSLEKGFGKVPEEQEVCFAFQAEKHGFQFIPNNIHPSTDGCFYKYQLNGSQQSIDFVLIEVLDGIAKNVQFDLKSTKGMTFKWNDGWFQKDVIYVISYQKKKVNRLYIGYGDESYEPEDHVEWHAIRSQKEELNKLVKKTKYLKLYYRFANSYSCNQFTDEFSAERWASVEKRLA